MLVLLCHGIIKLEKNDIISTIGSFKINRMDQLSPRVMCVYVYTHTYILVYIIQIKLQCSINIFMKIEKSADTNTTAFCSASFRLYKSFPLANKTLLCLSSHITSQHTEILCTPINKSQSSKTFIMSTQKFYLITYTKV